VTSVDDPSRIDPTATLFVTRPQPDADHLCAALRARGRQAIAFPVLAIEATGDEGALRRAMARIDAYRLVVFVSPNAIRRALAARDGAWPSTTTIGVMGPGSRATLEALGIAARIVSPASRPAGDADERFDSESLFAALDDVLGLSRGLDGPALILRGNGGRAWFAERLRGLGIVVDEVEAYRRVRPQPDAAAADALRALFVARGSAAFVVTSSEGLGNLEMLVAQALAPIADPPAARTWLHAATVVAPHARIVAEARRQGFSRVVASGPGDHGILAQLE
jgi:uroporphyrinogen III methyltransferase/synthase